MEGLGDFVLTLRPLSVLSLFEGVAGEDIPDHSVNCIEAPECD